MSALERELDTYKKSLQSLMAQQGKFVVIHEDKIVGTFDSYADALKAGYDKVGTKPFLVKKISPDEHLAYFTRDVTFSCRA